MYVLANIYIYLMQFTLQMLAFLLSTTILIVVFLKIILYKVLLIIDKNTCLDSLNMYCIIRNT